MDDGEEKCEHKGLSLYTILFVSGVESGNHRDPPSYVYVYRNKCFVSPEVRSLG